MKLSFKKLQCDLYMYFKVILHFFEKPHYNQGKFELVVGTARDITDAYYSRKNLQRALSMLQSQQVP